MNLNKKCKHCGKQLTSDNAAKKNEKYFRNECKSCRSFHVTQKYLGSDRKKKYMKEYHEKNKIIIYHDCLTCNKPCIKKYELAFCSHICRFMHYVEKTDSCWLWTGYLDVKGYGKTNINSDIMTAHRASYILFKGSIEPSMFICHSCNNPSCVNPDHLWQGTHKDNMQDMHDKGRIYTKLSTYQVNKIRQLYKDKIMTCTQLSEKYNISSGHVTNIIKRRIWKHI